MNLKHRVDVNKPCAGCLGATPFWTACARGHAQVVEFLCKFAPDVDVVRANAHGVRPIDAARGGGNAAVVKALQRHAAAAADAKRRAALPQLPPPRQPSPPKSAGGAQRGA